MPNTISETFHPLREKLSQLSEFPTEVRRVFHGRGRCYAGLEQLTIDWLQGQILCCVFKPQEEEWWQALHELFNHLMQTELWQQQVKSALVQHRYQSDSALEVLHGELNSQVTVVENQLQYGLSVGGKQNVGLFFDMRLGREWVQQNAAQKRVLNLFAYTCGFSVAAIAGGAEHVVNLDMSKAALSQGRKNHQLNNHNLGQVSFLGHELFKSWGKVRKSGPYDLIVIDPPSFQKGSFALTKDYQRILRRLPELMTEDGLVLACVNDPAVSQQFLIDEMAREAAEVTFQYRLDNPPEFPDIDADSGLKCLVFARG